MEIIWYMSDCHAFWLRPHFSNPPWNPHPAGNHCILAILSCTSASHLSHTCSTWHCAQYCPMTCWLSRIAAAKPFQPQTSRRHGCSDPARACSFRGPCGPVAAWARLPRPLCQGNHSLPWLGWTCASAAHDAFSCTVIPSLMLSWLTKCRVPPAMR